MNCLFCKSNKVKKTFKSLSDNIIYNICSNCGCHYQNPIQKVDYDDSYWISAIDPDGNKREFINEREDKLKNWYGDSIKFVNYFRDISVLDLGCGLGFFLSALNNDIKKFGIEYSSFATNYIKDNFPEISTINSQNLEDAKKFNTKFDVIMCYHVIEHLQEPQKLIDIIKKNLKNNGYLIIGTPLIDTIISKFFGENYRLYSKSHINLFNLKSLKILLKKDFKIIKIEKPFFKTKYNTLSNFIKLFNNKRLSPPFYGSIVTLYAQKK